MSDTLRCSKCQRDLPVDDFSRDRRQQSRGGRRYTCRECSSDYACGIRGRNRKLIREAKDVPCMDCGVWYPYHIMQFDHRDPDKKDFTLGGYSARALQKVKDEIAKCDIVCSNCHADRSYKRREEALERGETVGCIVPRGSRHSPKTQTPSLPDTPALY